MIDLSRVTLWTAVFTEDLNLLDRSIRVLCYCSHLAKFHKVILFSYVNPNLEEPWELVQIPKFDFSTWNIFVTRLAPRWFDSDFAMSVHEDGFFYQPQLWSSDFLKYDYIGAPWEDGVVGNGGFNLESRRFYKLKMHLPPEDIRGLKASDELVCRVHRAALEAKGLKFAPTELSAKFSTENTHKQQPSFGFHGRRATPEKYWQGWRFIEAYERG